MFFIHVDLQQNKRRKRDIDWNDDILKIRTDYIIVKLTDFFSFWAN